MAHCALLERLFEKRGQGVDRYLEAVRGGLFGCFGLALRFGGLDSM